MSARKPSRHAKDGASPPRSAVPDQASSAVRRKGAGPTVFVVGAGRLGSALVRGLETAGAPVVGTWTRTPGPRAAGLVPAASGPIPAAISGARLVFLAVPDRAVASTAAALAPLLSRGQVAAHCAGALDLTPLDPLARHGIAVGSLHPLVAAAPGAVQLAGSSAAVDGSPAVRRLLAQVARSLGMVPLHVPSSQRTRYHAAASLAANGLVALADLAAELLREAGIPRSRALHALLPLLGSSLAGLTRAGLPGALTGPVARGDAAVVEQHLLALAGGPAEAAYRALAVRAARLAEAQGRADPAGLRRIGALLREPSPRRRRSSGRPQGT